MIRLLSVLTLVAFASACARPTGPSSPPETGSASEALAVRTDSLVVSVDSLLFTADIAYPQLTGSSATARPETVVTVNTAIRDSVTALAEGFRPAAAVAPENRDSPQYAAEVSGSTGEVFLGRDAFSALIEVYAFTGGAHGNTFFHAINRDLRTGAPIMLGDLFQSGMPWSDSLSAHARRALYSKLFDNDPDATPASAAETFYSEGFDAAAMHHATFTLSADSLTVHFVPYEVAYYAFGTTDVPVAYRDLAPMLRSDGVAGRLRVSR